MDKRIHRISAMAPEYVFNELNKRKARAGCTQSDLVLDLICLHLYGKTYGEVEAIHRRAALQETSIVEDWTS
jgi:hypothetical protein